MGCISWVIFGALAGWVASLLMGRSKRMGCLSNIFIGILGSALGGLIFNLLFDREITGFNLPSFGIAVVGAVVLLGITGWYSQRKGF